MKKLIDVHSHLIPGVDDGCVSWAETKYILQLYAEQNVEAIICTPHYGPCGFAKSGRVDFLFKQVRAMSRIPLYRGNELMYRDDLVTKLHLKEAQSLCRSKYILVEFEEWGKFHVTEEKLMNGMRRLMHSEYTPILAHAERYRCLRHNPKLCDELVDMGVKIQINAFDIIDQPNPAIRGLAQYLLKHKLAFCLGSDTHGFPRPPIVSHGVRWVYENCPADYADDVVHDNAEKIIEAGF